MLDISKYPEMLDDTLMLYLLTDDKGVYIYGNNTFTEFTGYTSEELSSQRVDNILFDKASLSIMDEMVTEAKLNRSSRAYEIHVVSRSGEIIPILCKCKVFTGNGYRLWSGEDMRRIKNVESELRNNFDMISFALENTNSFSWEISDDLKHIYFGPTFQKVTGYAPERFHNSMEEWFNIFFEEDAERARKLYGSYLDEASDFEPREYKIVNSEGDVRVLLVKRKFRDESRKSVIGVAVDITEQKETQVQLEESSYRDGLTGLYSSQYLIYGLNLLSQDLSEKSGRKVAFMGFDIKGFRKINEIYGYEHGNSVLVATVNKLLAILVDSMLFRVSGDEFLAVFEDISNIGEVEKIARDIHKIFSQPIITGEISCFVDLAIGIAASGDKSDNILKLFKDAEIALYYAKRDEVNSICVLNESMRELLDRKSHMEIELKNAIRNGEFVLWYQPQISVRTKKVAGAEALIRWIHPQKGMISPTEFIPIAEESGRIIAIGDFVIKEAIRQVSEWRRSGIEVPISINVSAKQFTAPDFVEKIFYELDKYSLPPSSIIVEVTESVFITDFDYIMDTLSRLREYGIKISLDDFGTGYSSLGYLGKIPLDDLKIDKSFIDSFLDDKKSMNILKHIILLAHSLDLYMVAEGVENEEQLAFLEMHGCDSIQGYFYSKPLPPAEFKSFVTNFSAVAAT